MYLFTRWIEAEIAFSARDGQLARIPAAYEPEREDPAVLPHTR